jgi:hydroxymethylbilane synthase
VLRPDAFWPAVSQGALGIQIRADDRRLRLALEPLDDPATHQAVRAERSCLAALAGGCLAPIGAWGHQADGQFELGGCVLEDAGDRVTRIVATVRATVANDDLRALSGMPESLGKQLAGMLLDRGAEAMLARMRPQPPHG